MRKEKINITKKVMKQIREGKISMKPRIYFIFGSIITFTGLIFSIISSIFFISLTRFVLRSRGPMKAFKIEQLISNFPWWIPFLAVLTIVIGTYLIKKYDFSYKKNFLLIVAGFIVAIVISGLLIDYLNLELIWNKRGPMRRFYQQYDGNNKQRWKFIHN